MQCNDDMVKTLKNVYDTMCRRPNIDVCNSWKSFEPFQKWVYANGYEAGARIVRIDKAKGFSPTNTKIIKLKYANNMNHQLRKLIGVDPKCIKIKIL